MKIGVSKTDITAYKEGVAMLGYGQPFNIMKSIETKLYARAFVFKNAHSKIAYVHCEICFITQSLKSGVLNLLNKEYPQFGYTDQNLLLNAQHTHSGPSGYSYYGLYNAAAPGFVSEIYTQLVIQITEAIIAAEKNFREAQLFLGRGTFESHEEIGFQRSLKAYLKNPEAKNITEDNLENGIDREMTLLKIVSEKGENIGSINWFGVHPTNMSNTNTAVSSDNKGYAADYFEKNKGENFIAAFAQNTAGDVTPKFTYNPKRHFQRGKWDGKYEDDIESAQYNGNLQYKKALAIYNNLASKSIDTTELDSGLQHVDFGNVSVNPKFTNGLENVRTSPACMGSAFFYGTRRDGPGMVKALYYGGIALAKFVKGLEYIKAPFMPKEWRLTMLQKYYAQGNKAIIIESGARKILGTYNVSKMIIPGWADETVHALKEFHRKGAFNKHPWTQQVLPLQILKLGTIALVSFPFEITTIAGQRLKKSVGDILLGNGYTDIILCPYSNSYAAYITTFEEYQVQNYEGGHTVFGEWSLAALQTEFEKLAVEMLKPKAQRNLSNEIVPRQFTENDLEGFKYYKNNVYKKFLRKTARKEKRNLKKKAKA
jgi:neutral ceramidase